jgi:hypothetical protein
MTAFRIQELTSLGFEWVLCIRILTWEDRLSELASYRKIHGHCNIPGSYSGNTKLGKWVSKRRRDYRNHLAGSTSSLTTFRIAIESLGFEWSTLTPPESTRLSELANYRTILAPQYSPKPAKTLANWVVNSKEPRVAARRKVIR